MKPHRLHMENFGPFPDTTVDFDQLGDVVYMIVGETGAGKTMIFDGLSFALFGKASGDKRKNVSLEDFYCRHVEKDENGVRPKMVVELTFSEKGHEYRVLREIFWGKTGKAANCSVTSRLFKDGTDITDQRGDNSAKPESGMVTQSVEEIIGLKADDFKKIIMLAQGEFQRFLEASGKERNVILGRIYNNSAHIDLELRLKAAYSSLTNRKNDVDNKMKEELKSCTIPEDLSEEDRVRLDLDVEDKDDLWDALSKVEALLEAKCTEIASALLESENKLIELERKKVKAEQDNRLLDQRKKLEKEREDLASRASEFDVIEKQMEKVGQAGKILPWKDAAGKASAALSEAIRNKEDLERQKKDCEDRVSGLKERAEALEKESLPVIEEKQKKVLHLRSLADVYADLETYTKRWRESERTVSELSKSLEKASKDFLEAEQKKKENDEDLSAYEQAGDSAVANAKASLDSAKEKGDALEKFSKAVEETKALAKQLSSCEQDFFLASDQARKARDAYDEASSRLRKGRAGSLAKEMMDALEKVSEVVCPVCGVVHTKADREKFAKETENIPGEEEVDDLYKKLTAANEKEHKLHGDLAELRGRSELAQKTRVEEAKGLLRAEYTFEELLSSNAVQEEAERLKTEQDKLDLAYREALKARDIRKAALDKKKEYEDLCEKYSREKEEIDKKKQEEDKKLTAYLRDVENAKDRLKGCPETKDLAEREQEEAERSIKTLQESCEKAKKASQDMERTLGEVSGQLREKEQQIVKLRSEKEKADGDLEGKLAAFGYSGLFEVTEILTVDGKEFSSPDEVSDWCAKVEKDVKDYRGNVSETETRLNENLKNSKDLSYVDLARLEEELRMLQAEKKDLDAKSREEDRILKQTRESIKKLHGDMDAKNELLRIETELKPMLDNTTGVYKFRDYVLGDFFKQIVEHASHYFMELMDGKYSLEAVNHVNKTAKKGEEELRDLDLQAIDEKGHRSSIALLSGGQSFEASLALALGLSEVVQMQKTGRVHIESMFIDEGFGTLDGHRLDQSMKVLNSMTAQDRQIGIITHVEKLVNADTYKKLEVSHKDGLSTVKFVDNK